MRLDCLQRRTLIACCEPGGRARHGGLATQLVFACAHLGMHLTAAISLMLLLELATETCIKCVLTYVWLQCTG
jgi:hypothetical protein